MRLLASWSWGVLVVVVICHLRRRKLTASLDFKGTSADVFKGSVVIDMEIFRTKVGEPMIGGCFVGVETCLVEIKNSSGCVLVIV